MDFFTHQEKARRYSKVLMLYFFIALLVVVFAVNFVVYYFFIFLELYPYTPENWFSGSIVYYVSAGTVLLIVSGSLYRWLKLKSGGHVIAQMLGAKRLDLHTSEVKKRQLINVIEEMSIASGVPLPEIYVLEEEQGINAFVAGYLPTEAVMVVTQGAVESLNREELQGVVAHEYSHILNGDMQINIKLVAILAGILMISMAGRLLVQGGASSTRRAYVTSRGAGRNGSASALVVLGLLLQAVGFIGVFCGRVIKAAVSRQREYLADAAAVQFTRNPQGIASALNKIAEVSAGSRIHNAHAEDMSHMCFSEALKRRATTWLVTHPPLVKRIARIYPGFLSRVKARRMSEKNAQPIPQNLDDMRVAEPLHMVSAAVPITAKELSNTVGQIDQAHIHYAEVIHQAYSKKIMSAVHQPQSAKNIIWAMILVKMDLQSIEKQVHECLGVQVMAALDELKGDLEKLNDSQRMPLFDMVLPSLKRLPENDINEFIEKTEKLIIIDKRYTLFEFVLLSLLQKHLSASAAENKKIEYFSFRPLTKELQLIFSVMAQSSGRAASERERAYLKVINSFSLGTVDLLVMKSISAKKILHALAELSRLSPLLKRSVIEACSDIALEDAKIKTLEYELLRAISGSLDCPMPPLLPGTN